MQALLRHILRREGAHVEVAGDGEQALLQLARERFDAVLMDVSMPRLNGMAATRAIRDRPQWRELIIVGISAHAMAGDREACLDAGMNEYMTKPINRDALVATLCRLLEH